MNWRIIFVAMVWANSVAAQVSCNDAAANVANNPLGELNQFMLVDPQTRLAWYAQQDRDYTVVSYDSEPSEVTPTSVSFTPNRELQPGQCIYLRVPAHLRDRPILFANLGHQQQHDTGWENGEDFGDKNPGLTTVQLNETNSAGESRWRYWNGQSSGNFGAKFAEKDRMEQEGLYEWYKYGHSDIRTDTRSTAPLNSDAIRLCSIGADPVTIGNFSLKVHPGVAANYVEQNFSPSNAFGDSLTAAGRHYGERSNSLMLNSYGSASEVTLPSGWTRTSNEISIPATPGQTLRSMEVAIGDQQASGEPGYARLNVHIVKASGERITVIANENVPPAGVLVGAPYQNYVMQPGDRIVVGATSEAFLMGVRLGHD